MPQHILAIDQGTTSTRAIVFDAGDAKPLASAQVGLAQHFPQPGWVEHDPIEIAAAAVSVARQAVEKAGLRMAQVSALGIANQRETTVLWERSTGRPVANAIAWQCRRTAEMCRNLAANNRGPDIRQRTGLVIDPYFSATKLRWLLDTVPDGQRRAEDGGLCFGTVDSWLLYRLTGGGDPGASPVHRTDSTNASRTMLLNIHDLAWDPALLSLFDIPPEVLPEVIPSAHDFAVTSRSVLGAEVPVTGVAGDQHAALYGQACFDPGAVKCTYGTGAFVLSVTGSRPPLAALSSGASAPARPPRAAPPADDGEAAPDHGLLVTLGWQAGSRRAYALEGSVFVTGAAVQWLRDGLGVIRSAEETEDLAGSVEGTDGVYFVPAFAGLGAPHWDAGARGAVTGITRGTTRAHVVRAALEATAYQVRDVLVAMDNSSRRRGSSAPLRADGGQTANSFLMQFQADILDRPVEVSAFPEATALGAAFLAGRGASMYKSEADIAKLWQGAHRYEPRMTVTQRQSLIAGWHDAVRRSKTLVR